jgi:MFS family permease
MSLIGFFGIFTTTMAKNPTLPLYVASMNSDLAILGLIASISPIAGILFSFPVGFLADKLGKKKLLITASLVFVVAPLLYLFVTDAWYLIPIRFFHGMATAMLGPVASSLICGTYPESKGEKLGIYSSSTLIGRTLAPLVGGLILSGLAWLPMSWANPLSQLLGASWNFKTVYLFIFLLSLPVLFLSLSIKEDNSAETVKKVSLDLFFQGFVDIFKNVKIISTGLIEMSAYFCFGVFETYLPVLLKHGGQSVPTAIIGSIFALQTLTIALSKPTFGRLADRADKRIQIIVGIALMGLALFGLTLSAQVIFTYVLAIIFGLAMSLVTVATGAYVAEVSKQEELGASLGALHSIMDIGHSSGPLLTGMLIGSGMIYFGTASPKAFELGFALSLGICLTSAFVFAWATKKHAQ